MDIKCKTNPYYFITPSSAEMTKFRGMRKASVAVERVCAKNKIGIRREKNTDLCADILLRRPIATKNATGLLGLINKCKTSVLNYIKNYQKNLLHTLDHKLVFALIEKELFGKNSIDSITHDLDKLILYLLGFSKPFVSKIHRKNSVHHIESKKNLNLKSMLCDNIASSPEFKPEKKKSLRNHFNASKELQAVSGLAEIMEKYNYGENLDFNKIKNKRNVKFHLGNGILGTTMNLMALLFSHVKTFGL